MASRLHNPVVKDDPEADARALVAELYPHARWAVLTGSVITPHRTPGSDLDIVVVLPSGDPEAPHRESRVFRGWPVELFVHDEETLAHYLASELSRRKPHLHRMIACGVALVGDPSDWQARCDEVLSAGPAPLTAAEVESARYAMTDLLDDLVHARALGERLVVAATLWFAIARQSLIFANRWLGAGKWLLRELHELDPRLAEEWLAAHRDPDAIEALARATLDRIGGPLFDGYAARGERPDNPARQLN